MTKNDAAGQATPDKPRETWRGELGPYCLSRPGCRGKRLPFHGYCAACAPITTPLPPTRCNHPLRCYCGADSCVPERIAPLCELPPVHVIRAELRSRDYRLREQLEDQL